MLSSETPNPSRPGLRPILWIMLGLLIWGAIHSLGAFLFDMDYRKPIIVYGFMALFLGSWLLLLVVRNRRLARAADPTAPPESRYDPPDRQDSRPLDRERT